VLTNLTYFANPFPDTNLEYLEGIAAAELYRREIIGGFPDGQFKGGRLVNRAEAAKFLILSRGISISQNENNGRFKDVIDGQWYTPFVMTAAEKGIISGYPDGTFKPADPVNTVEFLKMLALTFAIESNSTHYFSDVETNAWYSEYVSIAERFSLFPNRKTQLLPNAQLTRNEVSIAIYQYLKSRN
jgi:N-acetylmuramoyl-L-alanine amidase